MIEGLCVLFLLGGIFLMIWAGSQILLNLIGLALVSGGTLGLIVTVVRRRRKHEEERMEETVEEPQTAPSRPRVAIRRDLMFIELLIIVIGVLGGIAFGLVHGDWLGGILGFVLALLGFGGAVMAQRIGRVPRMFFRASAIGVFLVALGLTGVSALRFSQSPEAFRPRAWQELVAEGSVAVVTARGLDAPYQLAEKFGLGEAVGAGTQIVKGVFGAGLRKMLEGLDATGIPQQYGIPTPRAEELKRAPQRTPPEKQYFPVDLAPEAKKAIEAEIEKLKIGPFQAALYRGEATRKKAEGLKSSVTNTPLKWAILPLVVSLMLACLSFRSEREHHLEPDSGGAMPRIDDLWRT